MSQRPKSRSSTENAQEKGNSVYDFLYYDAQRVASFLSQFNGFGHLTQITSGKETAEREKTSDTTDGTIGIPTVANVKGTFGVETETAEKFNNQRTYDPAWINLMTFLDNLSERQLLNQNLEQAGFGEFVLTSGQLQISDLQLVEKIWKLKSVSSLVRANMGSHGKAGNKKGQPQEIDMIFDFLSIMPHTIQATVEGNHPVWSTLSHRWLSVPTSDLLLSHGRNIPGHWNMVGILDARPDLLVADQGPTDGSGNPVEFASNLLNIIAPISRTLLGRPSTSFGVTPLAIFREITG